MWPKWRVHKSLYITGNKRNSQGVDMLSSVNDEVQ